MGTISGTYKETTTNLQTYYNRSATREVTFIYHFIANNHAPFHLWGKN